MTAPDPIPAEALLSAIIESADDAIISKDLAGVITSWNRGAERIFGYSAAEIVGKQVLLLIPPERHEEESMILRQVRDGGKVEHFETVRVRKSGERFPVSITVSAVRNANGVIVGASKILRDLSVQVQAARVTGLLKSLVENSDDAIVTKDLNAIVTSWNPGAERLFGYSALEMIGQPIWRLFPQDRFHEEPHILERIKRGESVDHFETKRVRKGGQVIDVSVTISPIRDEKGKIIGASKIARNISDQKAAHERLVNAHAELLRADQMKSEFLATLSHELRTPLNAILGWTEVIKESGCTNPEEVKEGIAIIERNARTQAKMIEDLLDVSRIVSGKVSLDLRKVDLASVVEAAIQSLLPAAQTKGIRLTTAYGSVEGVVMADKDRLQQVVWNLTSNSLKFTPKGGRVHITVQRANSHVEIAVADNGQGIKPDFLPFLFERFRQADASTKRKHGGLGLGLSIVKQLVEMHGGEVRATSPGEDKGTTFTVSLPVMASHPAPLQESRPVTPQEGERQESLRGLRILLVDDEPDSLSLVRRVLTAKKAEVLAFDSAVNALSAIESFNPDVIVSDIGMPEMDGYEFVERVRTLPNCTKIPAIALTALARSEDRTRALTAGFQTHIAKPVEARELVAMVRSMMAVTNRAEPPNSNREISGQQ